MFETKTKYDQNMTSADVMSLMSKLNVKSQ